MVAKGAAALFKRLVPEGRLSYVTRSPQFAEMYLLVIVLSHEFEFLATGLINLEGS